jgi:hypothetical protein
LSFFLNLIGGGFLLSLDSRLYAEHLKPSNSQQKNKWSGSLS